MDNLRFNEDNFIGKGGNWLVYRDITNDDIPVIIKSNKGKSYSSALLNVNNFELIKKLQLPTLKFLACQLIQNEYVLVAEDLNAGQDVIFVTPNISSPICPLSYIPPLPEAALELLEEENENRINSMPISERYRFENKLKEIINFEEVINQFKNVLKNISDERVVIEYDSYFFGSTKHNNRSEISFMIADFDNIFVCHDKKKDEVLEINLNELEKALDKFINIFIEQNRIKVYLETIRNLLKMPDN